jgi:hypothetical protein
MANPPFKMDSLVEGIGPTSFEGLEIEVCVNSSQKCLGTAKMKFFIFFHRPILCHKDIQKCKHAGYVKNILCPLTTFEPIPIWTHG